MTQGSFFDVGHLNSNVHCRLKQKSTLDIRKSNVQYLLTLVATQLKYTLGNFGSLRLNDCFWHNIYSFIDRTGDLESKRHNRLRQN